MLGLLLVTITIQINKLSQKKNYFENFSNYLHSNYTGVKRCLLLSYSNKKTRISCLRQTYLISISN